MQKFDNPLDNIRVASPCSADWDRMYGDARKRFCSECKLTVYNLSGMTREDAESLLLNSEGRLCVRFFRRADGTVLTRDCPVGWRAVKHRVSRVATAVFSLIAGAMTGVFGFDLLTSFTDLVPVTEVHETQTGELPLAELERFDTEERNLGEAIVGEGYVGKADYIYLKRLENGRLLK